MPNDDNAQPARLPRSAPDALRQFVACTVDRVELDLRDMGWIPKPREFENVPNPTVSVNYGWTPTSATIKVGYGFVSIELPASIVDGQLRIDSSNLGFGIGDEIDTWVDAFNRTLHENGKQLDSFEVREDKVALTKRAIPAPAATDGAAIVAPIPAPSATAPPSEGGEPKKKPNGCMAWILGGIVAVAAAIGLTLVVTSGDDGEGDAAVTDTAASDSTSPTPEPTPVPATPIPEVGLAPDTEESDAPENAVCGAFPEGSDPGNSGGYMTIEDPSNCSFDPASYLPENCDAAFLPCAEGPSPLFFIPGGAPGINHQQGAVDADTGEQGASTAEFAAFIRLFLDDPDSVLRITSDCGGNIVTGEAPAVNNGITVIEQPLQTFGPCTVVDSVVGGVDPSLDDAFLRQLVEYSDLQYVVGPDEPDPELPLSLEHYVAGATPFDIPNDWAQSSLTISNTLGAAPIDYGCFWFFEPENTDLVVKVLEGASCSSDRFWVFAAGTTDVEVTLTVQDTVVGHGGGFVNPLGVPAPAITDTAAFITSDALFDNSIFPCGFGHVAYTACAPDGAPMQAGAFVSVSAAMVDAIPLEADGSQRSHTIDFGPAGGPAYKVEQGADGWSVASSAGPTRARALFRHNSLTLVAPQDELPEGGLAYSWSTTVDGQTVKQPEVPVVGVIATPAIPVGGAPADDDSDGGDGEPEAPSESLEDFYAQLSASVASGDLGISLDRLHPTVFEAYPTECPAALESFADPDFSVTVIAEGETGPWTWELPDGRSFEIADATSVSIVVAGRGQTGGETESHVAVVDGQYRWFTFCG